MDYSDFTKEQLVEELTKELVEKKAKADKAKKVALDWLWDNQESRLLHSAKNSAKQKGLEFTLELSDIVIPKFCIYLGVELTNIRDKGRVKSNASIDRLNSKLGYVPGNIQIISDLANRMKSNATKDELLAFAKGIPEQSIY